MLVSLNNINKFYNGKQVLSNVSLTVDENDMSMIIGKHGKIAEGFVAATLLFCVGAMTIVGSIDRGIGGDNSTLYSKSVIQPPPKWI